MSNLNEFKFFYNVPTRDVLFCVGLLRPAYETRNLTIDQNISVENRDRAFRVEAQRELAPIYDGREPRNAYSVIDVLKTGTNQVDVDIKLDYLFRDIDIDEDDQINETISQYEPAPDMLGNTIGGLVNSGAQKMAHKLVDKVKKGVKERIKEKKLINIMMII